MFEHDELPSASEKEISLAIDLVVMLEHGDRLRDALRQLLAVTPDGPETHWSRDKARRALAGWADVNGRNRQPGR